MTPNIPNDNIGPGDRVLAIWQGQGYYHFTTVTQGNNNVVQNLNYPADIEGLWTFIYYTYDIDTRKAVAFVKYGSEEAKKVEFVNMIHPPIVALRFTAAGKDKWHPGFNGQFYKVFAVCQEGIFIDDVAQLNKVLDTLKKPSDYNLERLTKRVQGDEIENYTESRPVEEITIDNSKLVGEYSWSGWFKWTPTNQQAWHLACRLSITP